MIRICCISDLHGQLPEDIEPCDLVLICGDISPLNIQSSHQKCRHWLRNTFRMWADNLPCERVILIAGNHDRCFDGKGLEYNKLLFNGSKVVYLENSGFDYIDSEGRTIKIWGTPNCHIFGNWAFMVSDEKLTEIYSEIPENIDILISHDAPYGCTDVILQETYWNKYEHIGNQPLRETILEKKPKYNFHGHLHASSHEFEQLGDTKVVNTSLLDERYEMVYEPLYLDI